MVAHIYRIDESASKLAAEATKIAREVAAPNASDVDARGRFPKESMSALAAGGFYGLCVPSELGGKAQGPASFAAIVEELAQGCPSTAMIYVMHVSSAQAIAASTTFTHRDELLREIASGKHLTTLALSERGSRSHFWAPLSTLTPNGQGYKTSALKSWVTSAGNADSYVSSAQKPGAASPLESTIYFARRNASGIKIAGPFDGLGLRGNDSAPVAIENLAVAPGDLMTELGAGATMMLQVILPWFAIGTAAMANGICQAAVAATSAHLQQSGFEHLRSRLRDVPVLRARLAQMSLRTEQSRALLGYTLSEMLNPSEMTPLYVLQSRLSALEAALEVTDLAMKAGGGAAFSRHLPLERLFRDARAGWVMAPTADQLNDFIGRALTGLPLFD